MAIAHQPHVLIIDDDRDVAELVAALLTEAGFAVSILAEVEPETIRVAVGQLEPDCVLLDGEGRAGYGQSWGEAEWLTERRRRVPVIMFTADLPASREAQAASSPRSQAAHFDAVLSKPFDLDEVVEVVSRAVGHAVPFDPSAAAEAQRSAALREQLQAAGAREIHLSSRREWADFLTPDGTLVQLYWWPRDGVYYVVRHAPSGGRLDQVGRFHDLDAAIALAMTVRGSR